MRFSLRSLLVATTLLAINMATWEYDKDWGRFVSYMTAGSFLVALIGVRRLSHLESVVPTERKLRLHGKRKEDAGNSVS